MDLRVASGFCNLDTHLKKVSRLHNQKVNLILEKTFGLCNPETNHAFEKIFQII